MKAAAIPDAISTTMYIRKSFQLTGIDDYQVLNVRMKYSGGVVVFFNGNKVGRFNRIDTFDTNTDSIALHDTHTFPNFHIILATRESRREPTSSPSTSTALSAPPLHTSSSSMPRVSSE